MNTDIAGNPSDEEMEKAIQETRQTFRGQVDGFFNSKTAKYDLEVSDSENGFIYLSEVLKGDWRDFIPEELWPQYSRVFDRTGGTILHCDLAFLFPHHNLAIVVDDISFDHGIPDGTRKLEGLGYTTIRKRKGKYSSQWGNENKLAVLENLRSPEQYELKAIDKRASQILDYLYSNLSDRPESYTFGIFTQKKRRILKESDYPHTFDEKEEIIVNPVKKLAEIPSSETKEHLESLSKEMPLARAIGLTSIVQTGKGRKHVPMIDFDCYDMWGVHNALEELGIPGMVVASGNSYHFYGFDLLDSDDQWNEYIKRITSLTEVDRHWPDLQLKQGYSMLRLIPSRAKLFQPCFYEFFEPR